MTNYSERFKKDIEKLIFSRADIYSQPVAHDLLRDHAFFEHIINLIIKLKVIGDFRQMFTESDFIDQLIGDISFRTKVRILCKHQVIDEKVAEDLDRINTQRINVAHFKKKRQIRYNRDYEKYKKNVQSLVASLVKNVPKEYLRHQMRIDVLRGLNKVVS